MGTIFLSQGVIKLDILVLNKNYILSDPTGIRSRGSLFTVTQLLLAARINLS